MSGNSDSVLKWFWSNVSASESQCVANLSNLAADDEQIVDVYDETVQKFVSSLDLE